MANLLFRRGSKTEFDRLENKREDTMYAVSGESSGTPFVDLYVGDVKCNQQGAKPVRHFQRRQSQTTHPSHTEITLFVVPISQPGLYDIRLSVSESNTNNSSFVQADPLLVDVYLISYNEMKELVAVAPIMAGTWSDESSGRTLSMNSSINVSDEEMSYSTVIIARVRSGRFDLVINGELNTQIEGEDYNYPRTFIDIISHH